MLRLTGSGDRVGALDAAEGYLEAARKADDPELDSMTAGATVTWLTLKAKQTPDDTPAACDSVFEQYSRSGVREAPLVATVSLETKVRLQIEAADAAGASITAERLSTYLSVLPASDLDPQISAGVIKCATRLLASRLSSSAAGVLRALLEHLDRGTAEPGESLALPRLWYLLAVTYAGDTHEVLQAAESVQQLGQVAIPTLDRFIEHCPQQQFWERGLAVVFQLKIAIADDDGSEDQVGRHSAPRWERLAGSSLPEVTSAVEDLRRDLLP